MIVTVFLLAYGLFFGTILCLGYFKQIQKEVSNYRSDGQTGIDLNELVVLVPFRNEKQRINGLIKGIKESTKLPKLIVFVDDHSDDGTADYIKSELKNFPIEILQLDEVETGKKKALRFGITLSESKYNLTLDADVEFNCSYFENLEKLADSDMYILPVVLKASSLPERFFELDVDLANAVNLGIAGLHRPVLASGANLLFKRSVAEKYGNHETHEHIASGDDIYLLRDFRETRQNVRVHSDHRFSVTTETPKSVKEFIHQRLRWFSKTSDVKDNLSTTLAIVQGLFTLGFVALLVYALCMKMYKEALILYFLKAGTDLLFLLPYFNRMRKLSTWILIPIYELIFPLYSMTLLLLLPFVKPLWKNRSIRS